MVSREPDQDLVDESYMEEQDEAEETLSFCDLPIYSDSANWETFSKEDQSLSSSSSSYSNEDYFEFFSGEWSTSGTSMSENIIFCGKLIPFKETESLQKPGDESTGSEKPRKRRGFFRWKLSWLGRKRGSKKRKDKEIRRATSLPAPEKGGCKAGKGGERHGFSVRKVTILATPTKSRWHLMFGLTRLPAEMELRDIKSRQNRRNPGATFRQMEGSGEKGKMAKGLWAMVRALCLGFGGSPQGTAVMRV